MDMQTSCDMCGGEIYAGELCYRVNGENICKSCLETFAESYFAPFRMEVGNEG